MADPVEMVREAVLASFGTVLRDAEFALAGRDEPGPRVAAFSDGDNGAVAWVVKGIHSEDWPGVGTASGHSVVVKGATFVSVDDAGEPELYVVIDWADLLAQVGTLVIDRPVETPEGVTS